ncbi:MAG: tRNA (guanosine(37)-N1)-methyltransferase TrmD [Vampirovibrionales bacterium]|nr:tRNA (guanosine(37)-N1)-methyltransferase TrmD [Vampirovibrionales bacterium]
MRFSILTLFPEVIAPYVGASILGRASQAGLIRVEAVNPRDFTVDPHRKVDDAPYGGGSGMVMTCQPVDDAFKSLMPLAQPHQVLLTSPAGRRFDQAMALELSQCQQIVILCGHYEGYDERIVSLIQKRTACVQEVSLGDFVLTGGELAALAIVDAVSRQIPGVVQKRDSVEADSFFHGLLDYPHYTRPACYDDLPVPDVLLSGDHARIADWRRDQAQERTRRRRPDLLDS